VFYIDVKWHHTNPDDPSRLVSELDEDRWEVRKLEFYTDGRVGFASEKSATLGAALSLEPLPSIDEINCDAQFDAQSVAAETFEALWRVHGHS